LLKHVTTASRDAVRTDEASCDASLLVLLYRSLSEEMQQLADRDYELLRRDARHPSLRFKKVGSDLWSARVGLHHRALAIEDGDDLLWVWIGTHAEYDDILRQRK
jgi:hypothetical protein